MPTNLPEFRYLAANVRRLRLRHGWSQEQLAYHTGITTHAVSEVERALVDVSLSTFLKLATTLGVKPAALLKPAKFASPKPGRPKKR